MAAVNERLLTLWVDARLAEKDGFFLLIGGGSVGMPWWNAQHVNEMIGAWRALPRQDQTSFLGYAVNDLPEVKHED